MGKCYQGNQTVLRHLETAVLTLAPGEREGGYSGEMLDIQLGDGWTNDSNSCVYTGQCHKTHKYSACVIQCW